MHRPGQHWQWRLQHEGPGPHLENQFPAFWNPHRVCRHLHPLGGLASKPQQIWLGSTLSELLLKLHRWLADQLIGKQFIFFFYGFNQWIHFFFWSHWIYWWDNYCNPITPTWPNPDRTVFWDAMNPTQAVNAHLAQSIEESVLSRFRS